MASFDFITASAFRDSLKTDSTDMQRAFDADSWKVVHVLAGSIIEAVLADYLLSVDYETKTGKDPLKFSLGDLVCACRREGSISDQAANLSEVIRSYRNLIHPGRALRLSESPDKDTARVAMSLVEILVREIEEHRRQSHGLTAEQLVSKVESDPSSLTILNHLLDDIHDGEKRRLLLEILPNRYFALDSIDYPDDYPHASKDLSNLSRCFREAFDASSEEIKREVCQKYIEILREEAGYTVSTYETEFFRCSDLSYLGNDAQELAKDHILSRLQKEASAAVLIALEGISNHLSISEVQEFADPLIRVYMSKHRSAPRGLARSRLHEATGLAPLGAVNSAILKRLDDWINHNKQREDSDAVETLRELKTDIDLPF